MGYSTDFIGRIRIEPALNLEEVTFLKKFADTRRMKVKQGPYFVDQASALGQDEGPNVHSWNEPSEGQPGLWCQWVPIDDGSALTWSGVEKFYEADKWMTYVIDHFLRPGAKAKSAGDSQFASFTFDHRCDGLVIASGEEYPDLWRIEVASNEVRTSRYDVPDHELPEGMLESGHSFGDALYTYQSNPEKAFELLKMFLGEVPRDNEALPELTRFLKDLARVGPDGQRQLLETILAR